MDDRDVLAPALFSSLNSRPEPGSSSRKRKWQDENTSISAFEAQPFPPTPEKQSIAFSPICSLPRASVPLAWLDTSATNSSIPAGSLFSAQINKLEGHRPGVGPSVLIARLCPNGGLYALENVSPDKYITCALQTWVSIERVQRTLLGHVAEDELEQLLLARNTSGKRLQPNVGGPAPRPLGKQNPREAKNRRGVLARIHILPGGSSISGEAALSTTSDYTLKAQASELEPLGTTTIDVEKALGTPTSSSNENDKCPSAMSEVQATRETAEWSNPEITTLNDTVAVPDKDPFHLLRTQYLESLYLSKTSLAYFAKGPMTRARIKDEISPLHDHLQRLCDFYRESILPAKKADFKYKDGVFKVVQSLPVNNACEPDVAEFPNNASAPKKKRGRKGKKIGKDGLFPGEDDYVRRWWCTRDVKTVADSSTTASTAERQHAISDLRTRETKMQLLLILEVLALESMLATTKGRGPAEKAEIMPEPVGNRPAAIHFTPNQQSKRRELTPDLEAIIDKLCIWHTVGIDELLASPEKGGDEDPRRAPEGKDKLREFCVDVIIPFYAPRLPEQCKLVCRRLGGPEVSPKRPHSELSKQSASICLAPGAAVKSKPRPGPKRTLQRVLSEDLSRRHASPPVLSRAATVAQIPTLRRDPSESSQRPTSRGNLHKSVSFNNREIDLVADAKTQDLKRRKLAQLADQKRELDSAINDLKKPNRTKVAQSIMDDLDRRTMEKKAIQIAATPKRLKSRREGDCDLLPSLPRVEVTPGEPVIPSSTARPRARAEGLGEGIGLAKNQAVRSGVNETPLYSTHQSYQDASNVGSIGSRSTGFALVESTPARTRLRPDLPIDHIEATPLVMTKSQRPVLFTPVKRSDVKIEDVFRDAPMIPEKAGKAMDRVMAGGTEGTIYDSLGWNDDFD